MQSNTFTTWQTIFSDLKDPRKPSGNYTYPLTDLLFLVVSAVVSGIESWDEIEDFGNYQKDWLCSYGPSFSKRIPSHDTLQRVFSKLHPVSFQECLSKWVTQMTHLHTGVGHIAIDGKTVRRSYDRASEQSAIHLVSAYASELQLVLGQFKVDDKSNEITAIPELLDLIYLKDATVSIDAMGCQKTIAEKIIENSAHYVLAVKENQQELLENIQHQFVILNSNDTHTSNDLGHGRIEKRTYQILTDLRFMESFQQDWQNLKSIIKLTAERTNKQTGATSTQVRYYISDHTDTAVICQAIRNHWSIENSLHWVLDVIFHEDQSRKRTENAAENFSIILKVALNLLKRNGNDKMSIKRRRFKAGMQNKYREQILDI